MPIVTVPGPILKTLSPLTGGESVFIVVLNHFIRKILTGSKEGADKQGIVAKRVLLLDHIYSSCQASREQVAEIAASDEPLHTSARWAAMVSR